MAEDEQKISIVFFQRFHCDLQSFLKRRLQQNAPIDAGQAMTIAHDLCMGVAFVHSRRVIHRDLKPANILLRTSRDTSWRAVVADFGNSAIVAASGAYHTASGVCSAARWEGSGRVLTERVCTLWYAAPEMLVPGEGYSYPVDVWSLGLVLSEIEQKDAVCATMCRSSNPERQQLLVFGCSCKPAAARSGLILRARQELARHEAASGAFTAASGAFGHESARNKIGELYGWRFSAFVFSLLYFEPHTRVTAHALSQRCRQTFRLHANNMPCWWCL